MTFYYLLVQKFLNLLFRIFIGLKIKGIKTCDWRSGGIIASNHRCLLDPLVIGSSAPKEMFYFAKEEIFSWPVIGFLARQFNAFPTKRSAFDIEAIRSANKLLRQNKNLLVFIEGTRSKNGEMLPPKMGIGMLAYKNQVDIIPAYIHGSFHLYRSVFRYPGLVVSFGKKIMIESYLNLDLPSKRIYDLISQHVMEQIKKLEMETLEYLKNIEIDTSTEVNK